MNPSSNADDVFGSINVAVSVTYPAFAAVTGHIISPSLFHRRQSLARVLHSIFSELPYLNYVQGFHDVCSVLVLVCENSISSTDPNLTTCSPVTTKRPYSARTLQSLQSPPVCDEPLAFALGRALAQVRYVDIHG